MKYCNYKSTLYTITLILYISQCNCSGVPYVKIGKADMSWPYFGPNDQESLNNPNNTVLNADCSKVNTLGFNTIYNMTQCYFVMHADDCTINDGFVNYLKFPFCSLTSIPWLSMVILFIWLLFLFIALGVAAEEYFCPNLNTIAKTLRLSQNIAGVTFLALGNGAPDIFSVISAVRASKNGAAGLAIGELLGSGIFITTVIVGTIALIKPCDLPKRPFLRDSGLYIISAFWMFTMLWFGKIDIYQSVGFIILYILYVFIVVVSREVRVRWLEKDLIARKKLEIEETIISHRSSVNEHDSLVVNHKILITGNSESSTVSNAPNYKSIVNNEENKLGINFLSGGSISHMLHEHNARPHSPRRLYPTKGVRRSPSGHLDISQTTGTAHLGTNEQKDETQHVQVNTSLNEIGVRRQFSRRISEYYSDFSVKSFRNGFIELLWGLSPINEEWLAMRWYWKIFQLVKYPISLLLRITIPVVDLDAEKENWNKWLFVLQSVIWVPFCIVVTSGRNVYITNIIPLWAIGLVVGLLLAVFVLLSSHQHKQPFYHKLFAFIGFTVSVIWIYSLANEVVNLLQAFGVVFSLTKAILGLTFLAWGNSIGDFVADTTLARQGYPRTGLSACYGGPLLNTLIGLGIAATFKCIDGGAPFTFYINFSPLEFISAIFLLFNMSVTLIAMTVFRYKLNRIFGVYLLIYYVVFLIVGILLEANVIQFSLPNFT